jgi:hypothetical protein
MKCRGFVAARRATLRSTPFMKPVPETVQEGIIDVLRSEPIQLFLQRHAFDLG